MQMAVFMPFILMILVFLQIIVNGFSYQSLF